MKIFKHKEPPYEDENGFYFLGGYHPQKLYNRMGGKRLIKNPKFDNFSKMLLNFKDQYFIAEKFFFDQVKPLLSEKTQFAIAVVPSHDGRKNTGIREIAECLAEWGDRVDATSCLKRHTICGKQAKGGRRSLEKHLKTIQVRHPEYIQGQTVLILDDVSTTGASFEACKKLLLEAGATNVVCLAMGKTSLDNPPMI